MIIFHSRHDEDSRTFVAEAVAQYGTAVTVIDWYCLSDDGKAAYIAAGLSPSAFPSVIADVYEKQIPRELPDGKPALDKDGKQIFDTIPAHLKIIRKPASIAHAVAECAAAGRPATREKLDQRLTASIEKVP